jgi:hypothetical protein
MKYSDTISRKDEYQQEMNHQRIIHTGNSYQKTEWQEMETYGQQWFDYKHLKIKADSS